MTANYIMPDTKVNVVTQKTVTRTLELDAEQVEGIVRVWAKVHAGFTDPEIDTHCSWGGMFTGLTLTEETTSRVDDADTPVGGC